MSHIICLISYYAIMFVYSPNLRKMYYQSISNKTVLLASVGRRTVGAFGVSVSFILFQYMSTMYVTHYCCPLRITTIGIFKGSGADQGSYYNELFLRGKPHLVKVIRRIGGARKAAKNATIHFEPELYKISEIHPLPSTEMARVSSPKDYIVLDIVNRMIIQGGPTAKLPCDEELAGTITDDQPSSITGDQQAVSPVGQDRGMLAGANQPGVYHASTMMFPNFNSSQLSPFQQPLLAARNNPSSINPSNTSSTSSPNHGVGVSPLNMTVIVPRPSQVQNNGPSTPSQIQAFMQQQQQQRLARQASLQALIVNAVSNTIRMQQLQNDLLTHLLQSSMEFAAEFGLVNNVNQRGNSMSQGIASEPLLQQQLLTSNTAGQFLPASNLNSSTVSVPTAAPSFQYQAAPYVNMAHPNMVFPQANTSDTLGLLQNQDQTSSARSNSASFFLIQNFQQQPQQATSVTEETQTSTYESNNESGA